MRFLTLRNSLGRTIVGQRVYVMTPGAWGLWGCYPVVICSHDTSKLFAVAKTKTELVWRR